VTPGQNQTNQINNQTNQISNSSTQRHNIRLAQKSTANVGKTSIELAQELLVKKLGALGRPAHSDNHVNSLPGRIDLYAQHFSRPMDKTTMGAIQDLIEQGGMI